MELLYSIITILCFVGCNCTSQLINNYAQDPTFANMMCPTDQVEFQKATRSAVDCVATCDRTPGCTSLVYLPDSKTCYGIKSYNPFDNASSPLPGAVFYTITSTPLVEGLPDSQFTASSVYCHSGTCGNPWNARFNNTNLHPWRPATQDTTQWLQVEFLSDILVTYVVTKGHPFLVHWMTSYRIFSSNDCITFVANKDGHGFDRVEFLSDKLVTHVVTKGHPFLVRWTTSYKIFTSNDCHTFVAIKDDLGSDRVFTGNFDMNTPVQNTLESPVVCRCVTR